MKKLTYLLILMSAVSLTQADKAHEKLHKCSRTCEEINEHPRHMVCDSRRHYESRCHYDCYKKFMNWRVAEEAECKEGSSAHCWNTKCTEEEKKQVKKPTMCYKEPPHDSTRWPCRDKCFVFKNRNKDVEFVPCSEVKKE